MAQSTFYFVGCCSMDQPTPDNHYAAANIGLVYVGGSKTGLRRALMTFDVFGAAAEGRALRANDVIESAELVFEILTILGTSGMACQAERVTRADWDAATATWNSYKTGNAWTAGGGDVGTPPSALTYNGPTALGPFEIAGAAGFVTDAIANRGGLVNLRHMLVNESLGVTAEWSPDNGVGSTRLRLRVTYASVEPAPLAEPVESPASARGSDVAQAARAGRAAAPARPARAGR